MVPVLGALVGALVGLLPGMLIYRLLSRSVSEGRGSPTSAVLVRLWPFILAVEVAILAFVGWTAGGLFSEVK